MKFERISVIGLGYIGLPTAAAFASCKVNVIGVDVNEEAIAVINRGETYFVEPDLDKVVQEAVQEGFLKATTIPEPADAFLIAVPTPFKGDNYEPDLKYIEAASKAIAPVLKKDDLVVLESTSPVGATEQMAEWLAEARKDLSFPQIEGEDSDIRIAHCPERVLPGRVMRELVENDRVIGGMTDKCSRAAVDLYKILVAGECVVTNARTAEMAKLTENSFRDVNIAFANELSVICDKLDINVWELIRLANRHPRVNILRPGAGVGGHCIAVDPWFIVSRNPDDANVIRVARETNDAKPVWVVNKIRAHVEELVKIGKPESSIKLVCYGLSFKPDIDDLRESPALQIVQEIEIDFQCEIMVVEPNISDISDYLKRAKKIDIDYANKVADIHVFLVGHREFHDQPRTGTVLDFSGIWQ